MSLKHTTMPHPTWLTPPGAGRRFPLLELGPSCKRGTLPGLFLTLNKKRKELKKTYVYVCIYVNIGIYLLHMHINIRIYIYIYNI